MATKYVDHLTEDPPLPRQNWVCISFLSPEGIKNCSTRGLKIRGVYEHKADADKRAEEIQAFDPDFHVFVGEIGKWLPWDPDPTSVEDQVYKEKEMNDLMKKYKENRVKSAKLEAQRKEDMLRQSAHQEKHKGKETGNTKNRLKKEIEERNKSKQSSVQSPSPVQPEQPSAQLPAVPTDDELKIKQHEESLKQDDEFVKNELKRLEQDKKVLADKQSNLTALDKDLERMKELYAKMSQK